MPCGELFIGNLCQRATSSFFFFGGGFEERRVVTLSHLMTHVPVAVTGGGGQTLPEQRSFRMGSLT